QPLPQGRGELVLVVDDESSVRRVTRQMLERSAYRVIEAANGAEGLTQFVERQSDVRVVLTDLAMPTMDGVAFIRALRQLDPQVRVITVSGLQSKAHLPANLEFPEENHLSKPFGASLLLETLHRVLHPRKADRTLGKPEP
ncbi:MAG: response regulator, partial [Verrucomicrobia bacterium]|nr:response regulator [Verrucomicrobiota bacterium]